MNATDGKKSAASFVRFCKKFEVTFIRVHGFQVHHVTYHVVLIRDAISCMCHKMREKCPIK